MRVFLDCDGVLADFDALAEVVLGRHPRAFEEEHGTEEFWKRLREFPGFYRQLPRIKDADYLVSNVVDVFGADNVTILTGCPEGGWAEEQKLYWRDQNFSNLRMIVTESKNKRNFCSPGDVLIDDWPKYRGLWESAGGHFILHTSAERSLMELFKYTINSLTFNGYPWSTHLSVEAPLPQQWPSTKTSDEPHVFVKDYGVEQSNHCYLCEKDGDDPIHTTPKQHKWEPDFSEGEPNPASSLCGVCGLHGKMNDGIHTNIIA